MNRPQSAPKKTRRVIDTKHVQPRKVMNRSNIDNSCYRLSKTAPINGNKVVLAELVEPFADKYYREHPDEREDLRPPEEKLKEIETKLDENLEENDRFALLMKQKCYIYNVYGDTSEEALRVHASLGDFYNFSNKPKSALRHFEKSHALEPGKELDNDIIARIAVGTAEAHLALSADSKKELNLAGTTLKPALDLEIENKMLKFRRDLTNARIFSAKQKYDEAYEAYLVAEQSHNECEHEEDESTAKIYTEFGEAARNAHKYHESIPYYQKAYDIYTKLEMEDQAKEIEPFLQLHEEEEEQKVEEEEEEKAEQPHAEEHQTDTRTLNLSEGLKEQIEEKLDEDKLEANGTKDTTADEENKNAGELKNEEEEENITEEKPKLNLGEAVEKLEHQIEDDEKHPDNQEKSEAENLELNEEQQSHDSFESS